MLRALAWLAAGLWSIAAAPAYADPIRVLPQAGAELPDTGWIWLLAGAVLLAAGIALRRSRSRP